MEILIAVLPVDERMNGVTFRTLSHFSTHNVEVISNGDTGGNATKSLLEVFKYDNVTVCTCFRIEHSATACIIDNDNTIVFVSA